VLKNTEAIESLNSLSIYSVQELANIDPVRLYLNMPQQIDMINNMLDQAILHYYFEDAIPKLNKLHIRRFSQLLLAVRPTFSSGYITWPDKISLIDNGGHDDQSIVNAVMGIVDGQVHHLLLSLLLDEYRTTFFQQRKGIAGIEPQREEFMGLSLNLDE
jgi:hypothetical protein